jgi:uncharacterized membrane protein YgcG
MTRVARTTAQLAAAVLFAFTWLLGPSLAAGMTLPPSQPGVYVYDFAGIWSPDTEARAQAVAEAIRTRTEAQMVAVSIPSGLSRVDPDIAIADARTILDAWGVGRRGVNDGLVVLFDMDTSKAHGQVAMFAGSGFEDAYLTASERERIITGDMLPRAVEGNLDQALLDGLNHIDRIAQPGGNPERTRERTVSWLVAIVALAGGLFVFGMFIRRWLLSGRDASVPLIDDSVLLPAPPKGLTPALATTLQRNGVDNEAFTSALVDLGHRGLLTFKEQEGDAKKVDLMVPPEPLAEVPYLEARRRPLGSAEASLERAISRNAVDLPTGWEVLTSERLKAGEGKKLFDEFKADLGRAAKASGWFRDDPNRLPGRWTGIGIGLIVAAGIAAFLFAFDTSDNGNFLRPGREVAAAALAIVAALGVAIIVFRGLLVARTADGSQTLAMSLAYRNTLRRELDTAGNVNEAVEHAQSRLPWITTPDLLTVWAVAFGLKDEIDALIRKTFEQAQQAGLNTWSPAWFIGSSPGSGSFSAVSGIGAAVGSISATASSSSGGGFGGGGSGGGGGSSGGF